MLSMPNKVIELLEKQKSQLGRYYDLVNSTTSEKGFYRAISEYVRMILNSEVLNGILGIYVLSDRNKLFKNIEELTDVVLKDVKKAFKDIKGEIDKGKIDDIWVKNEVQDTENTVSGKTILLSTSTGNFSLYLLEQVEDVLIALRDTGHEDISGKYTILNRQQQFNGWKISDKSEELYKLIKKSKEQGERTVWGAWEKIYWAYATNLKKDETLKKYYKSINQMDIGCITDDMDEIMTGKPEDQRGHNFFENREEFRESAGLVHMRIIDGIDELTEKAEKELDEASESKFKYDEDGKILFYEDEVVINMHKYKSGRALIFDSLWKNRKVILNEKITIQGNPAILRADLCKISGYTSNENIDKAIKFFRTKLKGLPARIPAEKGFRLIIEG